MSKLKCSICGYIYDESAGIPEKGIAPGTKWSEVPESFACPLCGAPKGLFEKVAEKNTAAKKETVEREALKKETVKKETHEDLRELTAGELSALCSNLARGCDKQNQSENKELFLQLADYFNNKADAGSTNGHTLRNVASMVKENIEGDYPKANQAASLYADRGALRALVWTEKVSRILSSLLDRYAKEGEETFENEKIYVCDICGFIYVGNELPEICPVCKVPNFKITEIRRR